MKPAVFRKFLLSFTLGWATVVLPVAASAIPPDVDFVFVPGRDAQVGGPTYDFRVARIEIRNDAFLAFLNDALLNLQNERGAYLFFDFGTGSVYLHNDAVGVVGTNGSGIPVFDASVNPRIVLIGGTYQLDTASSGAHPVTGVTWYGAVKFCNWYTLISGFSPNERAYQEGPSSSDWHPVSISASDWAWRDLNTSERAALLLLSGFRLPMDAGVDREDAYSEWYKFASARNVGGLFFDALYGFGRSRVPTGVDANFNGSGDPFESAVQATTPVGFFDGVNLLADETTTVDTDNGYGLYDVSGNVWEWMQDQSPTDPVARRNRGGSWLSAPTSLASALGSARSASAATATTGFRIVQSVAEPFLVTPFDGIDGSGVWGGPYDQPSGESNPYTVLNATDSPFAFHVSAPPWMDVQPVSAASSPGVSLSPGASLDVTISFLPACNGGLPVGLTGAEVAFFEEDSGTVFATRSISATVAEPIGITGDDLVSELVFGRMTPTPSQTTFDLVNASATLVTFSARWEETTDPPSGVAWLTLDGSTTTGGQIINDASVSVGIDSAVASTMAPGIYTADVVFRDECTGEEIVRNVTLTIQEPFTVTPQQDVESAGLFGGPFDPPTHPFTITGVDTDMISWSVEVVYDSANDDCGPVAVWLDALPTGGDLGPSESADVALTINSNARQLDACAHVLSVRFTDNASGFVVERLVTLTVTGLGVEPADAVAFQGPLAGPFQPQQFVYTVRNSGLPELSWVADVVFDDPSAGPWATIVPSVGVILDPDGTAQASVQLGAQVFSLPSGHYTATITFTPNNEPTGATTRRVSLVVGGEAFEVAMVNVPPEGGQAGGPSYFHRIGRFEVTNEQYARFLNDVWKNRGKPRADFVFFDTDTGSVYINSVASPAEGNAPPANPLLYNAAVGRIALDPALGDPFVIEAGYANHPVVGVSWYGAAKFCNWLTLVQGMSLEERIYLEGATAGDWQRVVFDPSDPASNRNGFRLPMDDGALIASSLNEWYQVASRGPDDSGQNPQFDFPYGFGRNVLESSDANFLFSGDEFDNDTTPVGHFDGVNFLGDLVTPTHVNDNGFGVFDLTGNVAEWMHEGGGGGDGFTRGGHFNTPVDFPELRNDVRVALPADTTVSTVGFRVAQSLAPVDLKVTQASDQVRATGPVGGAFDQSSFVLTLENTGDYTVDALGVSVGPSWLTVDGVAPKQIAPNTTLQLPLRLDDMADSLGLSPGPGSDFGFVRHRDVDPGGVGYDFWISKREVTNAQFAAFLNDARVNLSNERGAFMYFDLDSSSVYINDAEQGVEGQAAPNATLTTMLYDGSLGRIHAAGNTFVVDAGMESYPVVGVSWYGAVKYCNWRTLSSGMPAGVRAYTEGVLPEDWHPVSTDAVTWALQDLSPAQRQQLVDGAIGFRLPMDDNGAAGASAFNEWHKFASAHSDDNGVARFDATYGFGRMTLSVADANFFDSSDADDSGPTPTGFFDGTSLLADGETKTVATENLYELLDVAGNVAEWMQDQANADPTRRAVRGGSFLEDASSVNLTVEGRSSAAAEATDEAIGFRVVRGTGHIATVSITDNIAGGTEARHVILDAFEPFVVTPPGPLRVATTYCDVLSGLETTYTLHSESLSPMDWRADVDANWVALEEPIAGQLNGTLDANSPSVAVAVSINESANLLPPGEHKATVRLINDTTDTFHRREVIATVLQPIQVTLDPGNPALPYTGLVGDSFETRPPLRFDLSLTEQTPVGCGLQYSVSSPASWVTIEPVDPTMGLTGDLPELPGLLSFDVRLNNNADTLPVGEYEATVAFSVADPSNPFAPVPVEQPVTLNVLDFIDITPDATVWEICCDLSEETLAENTRTFSLTNNAPGIAVSMMISTDVDWIDVTPSQVALQPGESVDVVASLNTLAIKPHGKYEATLFFENLVSQFTHERPVVLEIRETLSVTPIAGFDVAGRVRDGDVPLLSPAFTTFQLANTSSATSDLNWRVTGDQPWILIDGVASVAGTLGANETTSVMVSIDPQVISGLDNGAIEQTFTGRVTFTDESNPQSPIEKTRSVSLRLVRPRFEMDEASIPASSAQPGGPTYSFMMGRFAVTNEEFAAFLTDALSRPDDARGANMYFDTDTGDVYVNTSTTGGSGAGAGGRVHLMFSPAVAGQIIFAGGVYQVVTTPVDFSRHPVTGVSWYGAVKYCNWLTLDQGMTQAQRCYTEDTANNLDGWRPVTISATNWSSRDLNDTERSVLASTYRGYRLAMDDGYGNGDPFDAADAYNEWFKAAAWNDLLGRATTYAFGRDVLTLADANFSASGDPFETFVPATTPVGFFDGTLKGNLTTRINENSFDLFDLTGNVHEWLQGRYSPPTSLNRRTLRGGSWADPVSAESLRTDLRQLFAPPEQLSNQIGFRVVRSPGFASGDSDHDGDTDLADFTALSTCQGGPDQVRPPGCAFFDFDADADVDLRDTASFLATYSGS